MPIFDALKPAGEFGFVHAGPVGAGHYAKMVHNGIEYGLMHAYAEGYELLQASETVTNVPGVIKSWREGTVVRSWLLDLLDRALDEDPDLADAARLRRRHRRGPLDGRGGDPARRADERHHRRRCSPGSPPGRTTRRR